MAMTKTAQPVQGPFIGGMTVTKIVREHIPFQAGGQDSFGQMVDSMIEQSLKRGDEVQSITVDIEEQHWNAMRADFHNHGEPAATSY